MALSPEDQRARLSAAFLSHQVSQLEAQVDSITFSRDPRLSRTARGRGGSNPGGNRAGKRETRVIDPSALVHALPLLKRWVRDESYLLIIPLEALSILDQLKRSPPPLHDLARDATRFLETQLGPGGSGIVRAQKAGEELRWTECEKRFLLPEGWVPEPRDEEEGLPTAADVPKTLRSVLQCALFFAETQGTPWVLFHASSDPPPAPTADPRASSSEIDFLSLSSGTPLASYAPFFDLPLQDIAPADVVEAREWARASLPRSIRLELDLSTDAPEIISPDDAHTRLPRTPQQPLSRPDTATIQALAEPTN